MKRRRRNQPKLESLSILARFLNHTCEQEGISQAELAKKLTTSTATVSRWFRDEMKPTEEDLEGIAKILKIPIENFLALRLLDNIGLSRTTVATAGAFYFLASCDTSIILLGGMTMLAGTVYFKELNLSHKTILLTTLDPIGNIAKKYNKDTDKKSPDSLKLSWLASYSITNKKILSSNKSRLRLWTRNRLFVDEEKNIGEIIANDWIAIVSNTPPSKKDLFRIHFYNSKFWTSRIEPLSTHLLHDSLGTEERLILDTDWPPSNRQYKKFKEDRLSEILRSVQGR